MTIKYNRNATKPARLPVVVADRIADPATREAILALKEIVEVRSGARGNPYERGLTARDQTAGNTTIVLSGASGGAAQEGGVVVAGPGGTYTLKPFEDFANDIRNTRLYRDLMRRVDDATRFDWLPGKVRDILAADLIELAKKQGAEVKRIEEKLQSDMESFARQTTQVTASLQSSAAAVQQTLYAYADQNRATAGAVTTVAATLTGLEGDVAAVETAAIALADRTAGLEARYTVKVTAGGAMAGFGIAATDNGSGNATSAFLIAADKFAIVPPGYSGGLTTTPPAGSVPFGVDSITGNVYASADLLVGGTITTSQIRIGSGSTPNGKAFEVNSAGAVWSDGFVGYNILIERTGATAQAAQFTGGSQKAIFAGNTSASESAIYAQNTGGGNVFYGAGPGYFQGNLTADSSVIVGGSVIVNSNATYGVMSAAAGTFAGVKHSSGNAALLAANGSYVASMQDDGNFVVYHGSTPAWQSGTIVSDERLKTAIVDTARDADALLRSLRVVDFQWKPDTPFADGKTHTGFIAQEVEGVYPLAASEVSGTKLVRKEEFIPLLVKGYQELAARVEALEAA